MADEYISKQKVLDYLNDYLHSLEEDADTLFNRGQRRALTNSIQDILAIKATEELKMDYVSREDVLETLRKANIGGYITDRLLEIPTADVQPIVYAHKTINVGRRSYCSNCGKLAIMEDFCSKCGAKVEGGDAE